MGLIFVRIHSLSKQFPQPIIVLSFPFTETHLEVDVLAEEMQMSGKSVGYLLRKTMYA